MTTPSYLGKRVRSSAFLTPYYLGKRQDVGTDVDPNTLYPVSEHHSFIDRNLIDLAFDPTAEYTELESVLAPPGATFSLDGTYLFFFDFVLERPISNPIMRIFLTGEDDFQKKQDWIEIGQSTTPSIHTNTRLTFKDAVQIMIPTSLYGDNTDGFESGQTRRRIVFVTGDDNTAYLNSYTEWRTFHPTAIKPHGIYWWMVTPESQQRMYDDFIISPDDLGRLSIPASTLRAEYSYIEMRQPDLKGHGSHWDYPYGNTVNQPFPITEVWTSIRDKPWNGLVWRNDNVDVTLTQSELVNHDGKKLYAHVESGTSTTPWTNIEYHIKMPITIRVLPTFKVGLTPELQSKDDADLSNCTFVRTILFTNGYLGNFPNEPVRYTWSIHKLSDNSQVFSIEGTKTLSATLTFDAIAAHPGISDTTHYVRCNCTLYCPSKPSIEGETRFAKYELKAPFSGVYNTLDSVDRNTAVWTPKPTTVQQMCNVISSPFADNSGNEVVSFTDGKHDGTGNYNGLDFTYRNLTIYMDNPSYQNHKTGYWHHPNWAFVKGELTTGTEDCYANVVSTYWAFQVILKQDVSVNEFRWNFHQFSGGAPLSYFGKLFVDGLDSGYTIHNANIGGVKVSYSNSDNGNTQSKKVKVELPSFVTGKKFEFTFGSNQFAMRDFEFVSRL
jgi:hypothetical protein